jgi:NOL1/NOP2/sun family putative RNA methylase
LPLPPSLLSALTNATGFNRPAFQQAHLQPAVTSVRFNPAKLSASYKDHFPNATPVPWCQYGYYLAERPSFTQDPLWHAGMYYVQEASSMFVAQALLQIIDTSAALKVLDLCAAPGGKSTLLQSTLNDKSLLVANEITKTRVDVLEENITKWGAANVVVTNNEPAHFAKLPNYFDVILVDAPCSGSGLFRKDPNAINEWSEQNVLLCNARQQSIVADAWPALQENGLLIYATCSYATEENEAVVKYIVETLGAEVVPLQISTHWGIVQCPAGGYRFYPDKLKGEGFFMAVLRKKNASDKQYRYKKKYSKPTTVSKESIYTLTQWIEAQPGSTFYQQEKDVIYLPAPVANELAQLRQALYIKKAGIRMGRLTHKDFVPDHPLALSGLTKDTIPTMALQKDQAIQYLCRNELQLTLPVSTGWKLATYQQQAIGWLKVLPNRMNNYYPAAWRILHAAK